MSYADDRENIRLAQWCRPCLSKLSARLNHQPFVVNTPIIVNISAFSELARRWRGPLTIEDRVGHKYYGTNVIDADENIVMTFWNHDSDDEPSEREKKYFGHWTAEAWADHLCDSHWESERDFRAALEFIALCQSIDAYTPTP